MNEKITEKEKEILKYIIQFKSVNGYSPSVREIAQGVNTKSLNHVYSALEDLKVKEYITFKEKKSRTINVLKFL